MAFVTLCLAFSAFITPAGVGIDRYEVYLNDKLLLKEYAMKEVSLKSLQLGKASPDDKLTVYYIHCHGKAAGTGRSITVKDANGKKLKEWKFANAAGEKAGMVIMVKELLQLEKNNSGSQLTMYYASEELPGGQLLASL
jgi:hypothetical protein